MNQLRKLADAVAVEPNRVESALKPPADVLKETKVISWGNGIGPTIDWERQGNGFVIFWGKDNKASLFPDVQEKKWRMYLQLDTKTFGGYRSSLEEAFKTVDRAIYKEDKDIWVKMNASVILKEYQSDLTGISEL